LRKFLLMDNMFEKETAKLIHWIESNNKGEGKYVSNANHAIWGVINDNIFPYSFHYYGIILGYLNLYARLNDEVFLERAEKAGDFLCSLQERSGKFRFDKFEYETGKNYGFTLIHNVLPAISLLYLARETGNQRYFKTARKNIIWAFSRLWNGKYLSGCINQDVVAAESLATLSVLEDRRTYIIRAEKLADWCLNYQIKDGELKGGFIRGINYTMGIHESNFVIPWYDALTALSYFNLYRITGKKEYIESVKNTLNFLRKNFTSDGLVHSYIRKNGRWNRVTSPVLISPSGVVLSLFEEFGINYDTGMLEKQQKDGSFPSACGYGDFRDYTPVLGWNQFMFLYLSSKVEKELPEKNLPEIENRMPKGKTSKSKPVIRGKIKGFGTKDGYADLIKDYIAVDSQKIENGYFELYGEYGNYKLRVRVNNAKWKLINITPDTKFVELRVMNNSFFMLYFIFESILTRVMMTSFPYERVFNILSGLRRIKKLRSKNLTKFYRVLTKLPTKYQF